MSTKWVRNALHLFKKFGKKFVTIGSLVILLSWLLNVLKPGMITTVEKFVVKHVPGVQPIADFINPPIEISPISLRLHTGDWTVKTPVLVTNSSDSPLYTVEVKITVETNNIKSESIDVNPGPLFNTLQGKTDSFIFHPDLFRLNCSDPHGYEAIWLIFNKIGTKQGREFVVSGTTALSSTAKLKIWSFKRQPDEILEKKDQVAIPFTPAESCKIRSAEFLLERSN